MIGAYSCGSVGNIDVVHILEVSESALVHGRMCVRVEYSLNNSHAIAGAATLFVEKGADVHDVVGELYKTLACVGVEEKECGGMWDRFSTSDYARTVSTIESDIVNTLSVLESEIGYALEFIDGKDMVSAIGYLERALYMIDAKRKKYAE